MIPLRDQEILRQRFQEELTSRVRIDYFTQKASRLYVAGRQDCPHCEDVRLLLEELASLSPRIALTIRELGDDRQAAAELGVDKVPGIVIRGQANRSLRFFGMPSGNEFPGFIETIINAARGTVDWKPETAKQIRKVKSEVRVQVFVTPTGAHCPALARLAFKIGLAAPKVRVDVVEATEFPGLLQRYGISAVPTTVFDDRLALPGAMEEADFVHTLLKVVEGKPLTAGDLKQGEVTTLAAPTRQTTMAQAAGGLILPR